LRRAPAAIASARFPHLRAQFRHPSFRHVRSLGLRAAAGGTVAAADFLNHCRIAHSALDAAKHRSLGIRAFEPHAVAAQRIAAVQMSGAGVAMVTNPP
jgi:hypothetical protein